MPTIPKIIHQIWFKFHEGGETVPEEYNNMRNEWKRLHPGWTFVLWDDKKATTLLEKFYPEFLPMYNSYTEPIRRCDAFRFFVLHRLGGFYVDMDTSPLQKLDSLLNNEMVLVKDVNPLLGLNNGFMAAVPQHPFMKMCCENLASTKNLPMTFMSTGPLFLTFNYNMKFKGDKGKTSILTVEELKKYFDHHHYATWTAVSKWKQALDKERRKYMKQEDIPLLLRPFIKVEK